jgi:phototropin
MTADIKVTTQSTIPAMESIFAGAQEHVEKLLATDMYPRFVKHQITTSATLALADDKSKFQRPWQSFLSERPIVSHSNLYSH